MHKNIFKNLNLLIKIILRKNIIQKIKSARIPIIFDFFTKINTRNK
jgi:hypothetical protein